MFFEIENTPEHVRRSRRKEVVKVESPKEICPRLVIAPFSRPPQVVFDNVLIGNTCIRELEVFNPSKQVQRITLGRAPPAGLIIHLPGEWVELDPETCYTLTMEWMPTQPTTLRESLHFTNDCRGRYDVIIILKSAMNVKGKGKPVKGFKTSPGKMKKKPSKKLSPVTIYKKKSEIIYNTTMTKKSVTVGQSNYKVTKTSNKENISDFQDYDLDMQRRPIKCPFDSPSSIDFTFNTSEIFSNMRKVTQNEVLQNTYEKNSDYIKPNTVASHHNAMKPSNLKQFENSASDIFDNLTFTPLKILPGKTDKLDKGPKIVLSMNSDSELDDSLNVQTFSKENDTHPIIEITSHAPNTWTNINYEHNHLQLNQFVETTSYANKKIPNTSSPKELSSPNFSINTELSRISDMSFHPQRFSTERKIVHKINEIRDVIEDPIKLNSDTYTKDSPNTPVFTNLMQGECRPPHYFQKDNPKMCRQSLFSEYNQQYDRMYSLPSERNRNELQIKSPPRSLTPPLQSIPEESAHLSDTHTLNKTDQQTTFTINRTFDNIPERNSISSNNRLTWSKKDVRADLAIWKVPVAMPRKSLKPKVSIASKDSLCGKESSIYNKSCNQNVSLNKIGDVYSQSSTVDPFMSSTYYYDEEAVEKFESEFKRWLNYILTPPADLDSNIEQKVDVGKAWIENRNKEVPAAPTKEQVSSKYHNNHRLESLRRAAKALLLSPDIAQVIQKLNAQIEKKLIAIRTDKNLHLDVGLQKIIMELLLSYNPLWLRIGLEAIYNLVLPLKSNSDVEGLTTFIIQRMFKNPHLKNKHAKSNAPNMLLPAYMEAIKKFTLKKFFILVFFLDQAKQRKLIQHDPCLFCRNAICKESREVIIRFTRELIAGIGDITKHLRPLGYVVSHKQSFLDEYKYAVHNIAADIRDGVRLTKVMEIILMKNGLINQLRTPAISRLQKIHNVQVAFNALKEANFVILGDITANDIADGHREKTLSLLWQLIHVFRAPLFEMAANIIQTWWKKKYQKIVEIKKEKERILLMQVNAASTIQCWWRRILYNRLVEWQMQQITKATITIQKYCRMWLCKSRLRKHKSAVLKIEDWHISNKMIREAKITLKNLKLKREELRTKSAILIQSYIRRWLCMRQYNATVAKIKLAQSLVRRFLMQKWYEQLKLSTTFIQEKYRGKLLMRKEMEELCRKRKSALLIQSHYRMYKQRKQFLKLKHSVNIIETRFIALIKMRSEHDRYTKLKRATVLAQAIWRQKICHKHYIKQRNALVVLQIRIKALLLMKQERTRYLQIKEAVLKLQTHIRAYLAMKKASEEYTSQRRSAILIQRYFRAYKLAQAQKNSYNKLKNAAVVVQRRFRSLLAMRRDRKTFMELKMYAVIIQQYYRRKVVMKQTRKNYLKLRESVILIQNRYRAQKKMREERETYQKYRMSCIKIQNAFRLFIIGKQQRQHFLKQKKAATFIQSWFRSIKKTKQIKQQYEQSKQAVVTIQRIYRAYIIGTKQRNEYIQIKTATVKIQKYYRSYIEMKVIRQQYLQLKTAAVTIQRIYKSHLEMKSQRQDYLRTKLAVAKIQTFYRAYKIGTISRVYYSNLKAKTIYVQRKFRNICAMRKERQSYLKLRQSVVTIQRRYRAKLSMRVHNQEYLKLRNAAIILQTRYRSLLLMRTKRTEFGRILKACVTIQTTYRAYVTGRKQRQHYLKLREAAVILQTRYKALSSMKKTRNSYIEMRKASVTIQQRFRAHRLMIAQRSVYQKLVNASLVIQRRYRSNIASRNVRNNYVQMKHCVVTIQKWYRNIKLGRNVRSEYLHLRKSVVAIQHRFRVKLLAREVRRNDSAQRIQNWYRSVQKRNECRKQYLEFKESAIRIQSIYRMHVIRERYLLIKKSVIVIQRYYRLYKLTQITRSNYVHMRTSITRIQSYFRGYLERKRYLIIRKTVLSIQRTYRLKKEIAAIRSRRQNAATCIQKYVRRYLVFSKYQYYRKQVIFIQKLWKGKLITRLLRCDYQQKRTLIVQLQAAIKGYIVRQQVRIQRQEMLEWKEERRRQWAATKIQALFRGHRQRQAKADDRRLAELRRRWREGALRSTQESLKDRNEEAMELLSCMTDIETMIRVFRSLALLTEVMPMTYNSNAASIVRRIYTYMSVMNRSISSVDVLKYAASVLVNLTRYRVTGPKIYKRDLIPPILKYMWRYSNSDTDLFCILSTYIWLFSKYDAVCEDLTELLHTPVNHKMLITIKGNIERMKRMDSKRNTKFLTPQTTKFISHTGHSNRNNFSICSTTSSCSSKNDILYPALEPDYGIVRADKPRYFEDPLQAITCLFHTYHL